MYVAREKENFDTVLVDGGFDWPVLYAFYNNIPPHEFQKYYEEFKKTKIMQVENVKFGIFFNDESQLIHRKEGLMLIVSTPDKMKGKVPKDIFYAVDGGANTASYEIGY